jgi:hypothetical protein
VQAQVPSVRAGATGWRREEADGGTASAGRRAGMFLRNRNRGRSRIDTTGGRCLRNHSVAHRTGEIMKIRTLVRAGLIAGGLLAVGAATAKFPPPGNVYDVTYYSDATYSTRVGNERWTCDGYLHWGQTTIYRVENTWPCAGEE